MLMIAPLFCWRMIGITCLAARMQLFRLIATQRSNASSVISSSSASPPDRLTPTLLCSTSMRPGHHGLEVGILGDVGLERRRGAALGRDQIHRLLGGGEIVIDAQHLGALAREGQRGGAAVADAFTGALAGAHDDGDTILQTHFI